MPTERGELVVEHRETVWPLTGTRLLVGRAGGGVGADLEIADASVSRRHAELIASPDGWALRDLGSVNGTTVDGVALEPGRSVVVTGGEAIRLGSAEIRVLRR